MKAGRDLLDEINIIPLVDIVLVILIIFMITAPLMTARLEVELPKASQTPVAASPKKVLHIVITEKGEIRIGGKVIKLNHLKAWLKEAREQGIVKSVEIAADKRCPYGVVARVLSLIKEAGFQGVDLLTIPAGS